MSSPRESKITKTVTLMGITEEYAAWIQNIDDTDKHLREAKNTLDQHRKKTGSLVDSPQELAKKYAEILNSIKETDQYLRKSEKDFNEVIEQTLYKRLVEKRKALDEAKIKFVQLLQGVATAHKNYLFNLGTYRDEYIKEFNEIFKDFASVDAAGKIIFANNYNIGEVWSTPPDQRSISPRATVQSKTWKQLENLYNNIINNAIDQRKNYSSLTWNRAPDVLLQKMKEIEFPSVLKSKPTIEKNAGSSDFQFSFHELETADEALATDLNANCKQCADVLTGYTTDYTAKIENLKASLNVYEQCVNAELIKQQVEKLEAKKAIIIEVIAKLFKQMKQQIRNADKATNYDDVRINWYGSEEPKTKSLAELHDNLLQMEIELKKLAAEEDIDKKVKDNIAKGKALYEQGEPNFGSEENWKKYQASKVPLTIEIPSSPSDGAIEVKSSPESSPHVESPVQGAQQPAIGPCQEIYELIKPMLLDIDFAHKQVSFFGSRSSVTVLDKNSKSRTVSVPKGTSLIIDQVNMLEHTDPIAESDYRQTLEEFERIAKLRNDAGPGCFAKRSDPMSMIYTLLTDIRNKEIKAIEKEMDKIREKGKKTTDWTASYQTTIDQEKVLQKAKPNRQTM